MWFRLLVAVFLQVVKCYYYTLYSACMSLEITHKIMGFYMEAL